MSFNFVIPEINIGGSGTPPLQFFKQGFYIGGSGAPSWQDIVLSGNGSLTLTNAKANGLNYVKLFGACEQEGTPYPDKAADIKCNNGVIKFRYSNGLPLGYKPLEFVSHIGGSISLGVDGFDDNTSEIYLEWKTDSTSVNADYQPVFSVWSANTYNSWRMLTKVRETDKYYVYGNSRSPVSANDVPLDTWHTIECKSGIFKVDNTTFRPTVTADATPSNVTLKIGGSSTLNNYYKCILVKRQGEWIRIFLPAQRLSDDKIGLYDVVNNSFITSTNFTAGKDLEVPLEMYTDGAVETVEVDTTGGTAMAEMLLAVDSYQDVQSVLDGVVTRNVGVKVLDGTENWSRFNSNLDVLVANVLLNGNTSERQVICNYLYYNSAHRTTSTITYGECFKGDKSSSTLYINVGTYTNTLIAEWKAFLAEKYAQGNPVIVVYPLEIPTTETVTAQPLSIQAGTNTVEITKASIGKLGLEVSYKGTVTE